MLSWKVLEILNCTELDLTNMIRVSFPLCFTNDIVTVHSFYLKFCLGSMGVDHIKSEKCYNETILQRNYHLPIITL